MIASERRVPTNNSPGVGGSVVAVAVGNGGGGGGITLQQQRGGSSSSSSTSAGVNQILNSGRPVKIYVIDPRKFQERLEKYVGGLKDVEVVHNNHNKRSVAADKPTTVVERDKKISEKRNNNNNIIVDLTDDDVIIEEERLVSKTNNNNNSNGKGISKTNNNNNSNGKGVSKLPITIAPAPPALSAPPVNGILGKEKDPISSSSSIAAVQDDPTKNIQQDRTNTNIANTKPKKKSTKKKPTKKKKAPSSASSSSSNARRGSKSEDKMEAELAFLRKETTTRTGRVSKSPAAAAAAAAAAALAVNGALGSLNNIAGGVHHPGGSSQPSSPSGSLFICSGPNSRVPSPSPSLGGNGNGACHQQVLQPPEVVLPVKKKRVPPEMFRCVTCNKFYVGFAKFNAHFAKFPGHIKSDATKKGAKKRKTEDGNPETLSTAADPKSSVVSDSISKIETRLPPLQSLFTSTVNGHAAEIQTTNTQSTNSTGAITITNNQNHLSSFSLEGTNANNHTNNFQLAQCNSIDMNSDILGAANSSNSAAHHHLSSVSTSICTQQQSSSTTSIINPIIHSSEILPSSQSNPIMTTPVDTSPFSSSGYPFVNQNQSIQQQQPQTSFLHSTSCPAAATSLDLPLPLPSSLNVNEDTINGSGGRDDFFMMDFNPHISEISQIPSELLGQGSCSQQSFNSLENLLLADSNSQPARLISPVQLLEAANEENANGPRLLSSNNRNDLNLISSTGCNNQSTFFSLNGGGIEQQQHQESDGGRRGGPVHMNSVDNISSYSHNENVSNHTTVSIVLPVDEEEESRDLCINVGGGGGNEEISRSGCDQVMSEQQQQITSHCGLDSPHDEQSHSHQGQSISSNCNNSSTQRRKSIWEFVKEQIRLCGINQACGEISEMAEKLSKVARDKFYPIREEEIERMNGSPPIIQVETPFISHLLDLPFGTYIFKEDGGIRKVVPPPTPISSEISLTNGVEVDVDKFLSPDFDLISLPHLTNLDFTSICNNDDEHDN